MRTRYVSFLVSGLVFTLFAVFSVRPVPVQADQLTRTDPPDLSMMTFPPGYPPPLSAGGPYADFVGGPSITIIPANAFAPGVPPSDISFDVPGIDDIGGLLVDVDGDGQRTDERCDTNGEGVQQFLLASIASADALGNSICNAITVPGVQSACWIALGVFQQGFVIGQTNAAQCGFQDALVDGAEIQTAMENTKIIWDDLGVHHADVKARLIVMEEKINYLVELIQTPSGQRPDWPYKDITQAFPLPPSAPLP